MDHRKMKIKTTFVIGSFLAFVMGVFSIDARACGGAQERAQGRFEIMQVGVREVYLPEGGRKDLIQRGFDFFLQEDTLEQIGTLPLTTEEIQYLNGSPEVKKADRRVKVMTFDEIKGAIARLNGRREWRFVKHSLGVQGESLSMRGLPRNTQNGSQLERTSEEGSSGDETNTLKPSAPPQEDVFAGEWPGEPQQRRQVVRLGEEEPGRQQQSVVEQKLREELEDVLFRELGGYREDIEHARTDAEKIAAHFYYGRAIERRYLDTFEVQKLRWILNILCRKVRGGYVSQQQLKAALVRNQYGMSLRTFDKKSPWIRHLIWEAVTHYQEAAAGGHGAALDRLSEIINPNFYYRDLIGYDVGTQELTDAYIHYAGLLGEFYYFQGNFTGRLIFEDFFDRSLHLIKARDEIGKYNLSNTYAERKNRFGFKRLRPSWIPAHR